ncbi:MAG: pyruvate kinase [Chloroflexi bacterium]|nr:MAG: pyruvate kinase [Chloroflexota bacterium]MBA4374691.1 pyruvate kinase [Anaerolinea sp.]
MRFAKIVCTLGPSSSDKDTILQLIEAGMDVARLNFSHGTHESHEKLISIIRECAKEVNRPISILQDLQGPKLRVGILPPEGIHLETGQTLKLFMAGTGEEDFTGNEMALPLDVPNLAKGVKPGNRILLDDGQLELQVKQVIEETVITKVIIGGTLTSHKGVNLPGAHLGIPSFTEKDRLDLEFGLAHEVDYVAISFVETGRDIEIVREAIKSLNPSRSTTPIIAKMERPEAVKNLHEIIHISDGVMVARGDLGVETSPSVVPIMQKEIIQSANRHAKIVITATQMLDSMIHNPRPTRAEASDVANAIFDGSDAVMLSGETASGEYPVESVKMMDSIVREAEKHTDEWSLCEEFPKEALKDDALSICNAAKELAHDRDVSNIAVFTQSGKTALLMSKARPRVPIMAFTPEPKTLTLTNLYWGVLPVLVPFATSLEGMVQSVDHALKQRTQLKPGQQIVLISGFPVGAMRLPNLALLHTVGEEV